MTIVDTADELFGLQAAFGMTRSEILGFQIKQLPAASLAKTRLAGSRMGRMKQRQLEFLPLAAANLGCGV
ncbi:MAG: hypothetical protein OXC42_01740 [Gammaproteobacteria bacterium]|nr:hypothetical protein [Gammaproteobacteria bacterium]